MRGGAFGHLGTVTHPPRPVPITEQTCPVEPADTLRRLVRALARQAAAELFAGARAVANPEPADATQTTQPRSTQPHSTQARAPLVDRRSGSRSLPGRRAHGAPLDRRR